MRKLVIDGIFQTRDHEIWRVDIYSMPSDNAVGPQWCHDRRYEGEIMKEVNGSPDHRIPCACETRELLLSNLLLFTPPVSSHQLSDLFVSEQEVQENSRP